MILVMLFSFDEFPFVMVYAIAAILVWWATGPIT